MTESVEQTRPPGDRRWGVLLTQTLSLLPVLGISVAFGLKYGFNYGVNNQLAYFLPGMRLFDSVLFSRDWFVTEASTPNPAFTLLTGLVMTIDDSGWVLAIASALATGGLLFLFYWIATQLTERTHALIGFLLFAAVVLVIETKTVAQSYAVERFFQPSSLGALGFALAIGFFLKRRWLPSGLAAAIGGLFHINYLLLMLPVFGIAHLTLGKKDLWRRSIAQFLPMLLASLVFMPGLLEAAFATQSAEGRSILFDIRSPHHYLPKRFMGEFLRLALWSIVGVGAMHHLLAGKIWRPWSPLAGLLIGMMTVIWFGTFLTTVFFSETVAALFVWRLAPFVEMLCQLLVGLALGSLMARTSGSWGMVSPATVFLWLIGFGYLLADFGVHDKKASLTICLSLLGTAAGVHILNRATTLLATKPSLRLFQQLRSHTQVVSLWVAFLGAVGVLATGAWLGLDISDTKGRSNLIVGLPKNEKNMFDWVIHQTKKDALFLTPPDLEGFRFHTRRSIIVDWKAAPMLTNHLLEWHRRLVDIAGRNVKNSNDARDGYRILNSLRLKALHKKYGFEYAVLGNREWRNQPTLREFKIAYKTPAYVILKVD